MPSRRIKFSYVKRRSNFIKILEIFTFKLVFWIIFLLETSVFYSTVSNFNYFRPKGCWFFCPVSCVFLLHMGLETTTLQIWPNFGKPLETASDQWVKTVIFPIKLSRPFSQQPRQLVIFTCFSEKFTPVASSELVENQTPKAFTFFLTHLKSFSGQIMTPLPLFAPIQMASVFLFYFKPEIFLKSSRTCKEDMKASFEPSKIRVVTSTYWLILISCPKH